MVEKKPELSVVVVVHDMAREAPRTLYSLSAAYQRHISPGDFEIIVVDNGSTPALAPEALAELEGRFHLIRLEPASASPVHAINVGLAAAAGDIIGVMIDGARLVTPGLLHFARAGVRMYPRAVVASLGWYLGLDQQRWAQQGGYDRTREDALLASIGWPEDGYRLFEIGALDESSVDGWFGELAETNGLFLSRETWDLLGGYDEHFDFPGGGFANLDVLIRALELPGAELVVLLGEATFHQLHGGVATNARPDAIGAAVAQWRAQYEALRGRAWSPPNPAKRTFLGVLPPTYLAHFARALVEPLRASPIGERFDSALWLAAPLPLPADPAVAAVVALAESELRARRFEAATAVARLARARAPDEPAPQRLTSVVGAWLRGPAVPPLERRAGVHLACARAYRLFGDQGAATAEFHAALALEPDMVEAQIGLSELKMPGESYFAWLERFHAHLRPRTYLEIGVARGHSIAMANPPTRAIGVDPEPHINAPFRAEIHIYCETSDEFFARSDLASVFGGEALDLAFIDGLHTFQQALKDFINVEKLCRRGSVILFHDTVPLDEITQRPDRQRRFYTGDVWKAVLCLRAYRPDLEILTVATPWSGLTVVTALDPTSKVLEENYSAAVERFAGLQYETVQHDLDSSLNYVPNDWAIIEERLKNINSRDEHAPISSDKAVLGQVRIDLYVQLLIRILSNTIYQDPSIHPKQAGQYQSAWRETGLDWPAVAHSMAGVRRLENLAQLAQRALDETIPGDFIETGVWRGGCCILMRGVLAANGIKDRKVYVADSFAGLPPPDTTAYPLDEGLNLDRYAELAVPLDEVKANFARYGLLDDQVVFVQGWFSETLKTLEAGPFALIRLDGDLYESTYVALEALYPKLSPGGIVIVDDYNAIAQCREAVSHYRARHGITAPMHEVDWTAVWWRKD